MDLLAKLMPASATEDKEPLPVELVALQAEIKRLRAERATKEATEASLLTELQKRCNRVISLESELDAAQSQARSLQKDCDKHAAAQAQLSAVVGRQGESTAGGSEDDAVIGSVVALKARLATLEQERRDGKRVALQQEEELGSLHKQVEELKRVVITSEVSSSSSGTVKKKDTLPSAADLGLPEDVRLLLQRCPWTEAVLSNTLVTEELYEWEGWSLFHGWSGAAAHLSQSTPQLQDMVLRCTTESSGSSSSSSSSSSTYGRHDKTITDPNFSALVDPESVILPRVGWEWLGGWRVDDGGNSSNRGGRGGRGRGGGRGGGGGGGGGRGGAGAATDAEGWSYGVDCEELIRGQGSASMLVAPPEQQQQQQQQEQGSSSTLQKKRRVRHRRWVRVRVLSSVPGASDMVNAFLSLHAQVASLETLTHKLSEQVLSLQGHLNEREAQAARAGGLDRALVAMQARAFKAERILGQSQQRMARQEGEARLKAALEGGEGGGEEGEEGGVKAVGEAMSKWFAGLGSGEGRGEEGRKEGEETAKEGEEGEGGGFKKWFSEVKSSLSSASASSSGSSSSSNSSSVAVAAEGEGAAANEDITKGASSSSSIPMGTSGGTSSSGSSSSGGSVERGNSNTDSGSNSSGGGGGIGGAPLIKSALRWFSKEVLQQTSKNEEDDDPIEGWADEVAAAGAGAGGGGGDLQGGKASAGMKREKKEGEEEVETVPVERLSEAEVAALQKQLDEEKEGREGEGPKDEKETSVGKTGTGGSTTTEASSTGKKNKKSQSQPKEQPRSTAVAGKDM